MINTNRCQELTHVNPQTAFKEAVDANILSRDCNNVKFAGNYMYMGTFDGVHKFKHIITRQYL